MSKTSPLLPNGKRVHMRRSQMYAWSAAAAVAGAGLIAGLYFTILQMRWHLDVGPIRTAGFSLKGWWDGLFSQPWWPTYRHSAFRDIPEPSFAVMGVLTLLARPKYWDKQVSTLRVVTAPFILILLTFALGISGTWLIHYGLPQGTRNTLGQGHIGDLALGLIIGRILHVFWAPVGATYQGKLLQRAVRKAYARDRVPLWVRLPLSPPVLRERFSVMHRSITPEDLVEIRDEAAVNRWALTIMVSGATVLTVVGLIAHYWIGKGHLFPYLSS